MGAFDAELRTAADILARRTPLLETEEVQALVRQFLDRREAFLELCRKHGSPLYVIEPRVLADRAMQFTAAFRSGLPDVRVYYAVKCNSHPLVAKAFVGQGLGLDVSSGKELQMALDCGAADIVFSGPGKTEEELALAVKCRDRVTVLMDSFGELARLESVASQAGARIRAGVRLTTDERALWAKFGIAASELPAFMTEAEACPHVLLEGVQFHTSWNREPANHVRFIALVGATLRGLSPAMRAKVRFLDIGGGFWPPQGEWLQPGATPEGELRRILRPASAPQLVHHKLPAATIEEFARQISQAVHSHIFPLVTCRIYVEPGRWLVNDGMHLLLTVMDRKRPQLVITDAGTNAIGWERFETDYFPVINLSRPGLSEHSCYVLGSLCTPHDVWGYSYHGEDIQPGDRLLIPMQGAYTYSLRQEFIKPLPAVVALEG